MSFDNTTLGSNEISIKIGKFLEETPRYRRRFLRRLNHFNSYVKEIVNSVDLSPKTKAHLFDVVYKEARHSANIMGTRENSSFSSYLLITYYKTVFDHINPYLMMLLSQEKKEKKTDIRNYAQNDDMREVFLAALPNSREARFDEMMADISTFMEKQFMQFRKRFGC